MNKRIASLLDRLMIALPETDLEKITVERVREIKRRCPDIPVEYIDWLMEAGYGDVGVLKLYSGPIDASFIFGNDCAADVKGIYYFGDDTMGLCEGFKKGSDHVTLVDSALESFELIGTGFLDRLENYISREE